MASYLFERLCQFDTLYEAWKIVKGKRSSGGIDGISISEFDQNANEYITALSNELKSGNWKPQPYFAITIPKKKNERRNIGLLSVKDKIVQTAIKLLIEPRFEKLFLNTSYVYDKIKVSQIIIEKYTTQGCTKVKNLEVLTKGK